MAKKNAALVAPRSASLTADQMRLAIKRIERCLDKLNVFDATKIHSGEEGALAAMEAAIGQTLESSFGPDTTEFKTYEAARSLNMTGWDDTVVNPRTGQATMNTSAGVARGCARAKALLEQALVWMREELEDDDESASGRALRAYEGLDLHPEIGRAAGALYHDGHYANAILEAVKALNGLVRLRSGRDDLDGTTLMEAVFSPKNPVLKFNALADQSDLDEQKGFMMMFSGAVAGLRNPRAHKLIKDDPERALEFIAYVSLLAKLLDGTSK
jgi:uncharacterized protein (TIGR02391 family)